MKVIVSSQKRRPLERYRFVNYDRHAVFVFDSNAAVVGWGGGNDAQVSHSITQ